MVELKSILVATPFVITGFAILLNLYGNYKERKGFKNGKDIGFKDGHYKGRKNMKILLDTKDRRN